MSLYAFYSGQIISTVFGQVDHDGQGGSAARTRIRDKTSETDHTSEVLTWLRDGTIRGGH